MVREYSQEDLMEIINSYFQTHYKYKISAVLIQTNRNEFQRINGEYFYVSKTTTIGSLISTLCSLTNEFTTQINCLFYKKFTGFKIVS